jgi:hypothetical protein
MHVRACSHPLFRHLGRPGHREEVILDAIDSLNHLANLFSPALVIGLISAGLAKLVWWNLLAPVHWVRLAVWSCGACSLVTIAGLVVLGRDGKMATYGAMVLASALALWWAGFGGRRT